MMALMQFLFDEACILQITLIFISNKIHINLLIWHGNHDLYWH